MPSRRSWQRLSNPGRHPARWQALRLLAAALAASLGVPTHSRADFAGFTVDTTFVEIPAPSGSIAADAHRVYVLLTDPSDRVNSIEQWRPIVASASFIHNDFLSGLAPSFTSGTWSTEEVLSPGGGFDAGGSATMVTERILDLAADGRYAISSRSAGGGPGATFDTPAEVVQRGIWSVTRAGDRATLQLRSADGSLSAVPCALFEGKLLLGPSGQRKFFTRVR